jgi:hypothetical protein
VPSKRLLIAGSSGAAGLLLLLALTGGGAVLSQRRNGAAPKPWNDKAFRAKYIGSRLTELDRAFATLTLTYELENLTDLNYHLAEGSGLIIVRKMMSDKGLSQEEPIQLSYPAFLSARQTARIAIEITLPMAWPAESDLAYDDKLRDFAKERLSGLGQFVLVDETHRWQLELPGAWEAN